MNKETASLENSIFVMNKETASLESSVYVNTSIWISYMVVNKNTEKQIDRN